MRTDHQLDKIRQQTQDPGAYTPYEGLTKKRASNWKFGSADRKSMEMTGSIKVPGAGSYDIKSTIGTQNRGSMGALT